MDKLLTNRLLSPRKLAMGLSLFPEHILTKYEIHEWHHASSIIKYDFPDEWNDLIDLLSSFRLCRSFVTIGGGRKSKVSESIDAFLYKRGWIEKQFNTSVKIDEQILNSPTHKIDCLKNRIALEIEWNNKDPFFDRDLNNFRLLFNLRAISVGIIITRCDHLQSIFDQLGRGTSYGASTTHMSKLLPRVEGGGSAGCPILVIGISKELYDETC